MRSVSRCQWNLPRQNFIKIRSALVTFECTDRSRRSTGSSLMEFCWYYTRTTIYRVIQNECRGTIVHRQFRTKFGKQPPSDNSTRRQYEQFQETECVCIGGTEGTDIQGACVLGDWRYGYTGCVCIGGTEGTDIQSACVSGGLKVRIYRVCVYRGDW